MNLPPPTLSTRYGQIKEIFERSPSKGGLHKEAGDLAGNLYLMLANVNPNP
jgi:hypothetical protein